MKELLSKEVGKKMFLLGNDAVVRGALEAGIDIATTYPGTPSSEIGNTFHEIAKEAGVYFEFSTNEKVAIEVASAAAVSGQRALTFFKHVGLNVAADAFMSYCYTGVKGGHVVLVADDPAAHSSQNEQDSRYYAMLSGAPMIEPVFPQECKDMIVGAFDISESLAIPVLVRTTTRVNHVSGPVDFGALRPRKGRTHFDKDPMNWVLVPLVARQKHAVLLEKLKRAQAMSEEYPYTTVEGPEGKAKLGIITSGASYGYVKEALSRNPYKVKVLRVGMVHPMPVKKMAEFMKDVEQVLVVEELEPYMEMWTKISAKDAGLTLPVHGKDLLPRMLEFSRDIVNDAIIKVMGDKAPEKKKPMDIQLPARPPTLCPGCPHRATYYAAKVATKDTAVFSSDIGCYTLGMFPPLKTADFFLCMGSSPSIASGFSRSIDQPVIAFVGDSTFFHSAIPGLINAVHNKHKFVYVILDNRTTAMTGHQPHPGSCKDGMGDEAPALDIEKVIRGIGVEWIRTVDPFDVKKMIDTLKEALAYDGVSVIISLRECALLDVARRRGKGETFSKYHVVREKCKKCKRCLKMFACPAQYVEEDGTVAINEMLCIGCGVCAQVCQFGTIQKTGGDAK
jgi:indolepyruvate ferredoxin oxidoreductase alpha subunit